MKNWHHNTLTFSLLFTVSIVLLCSFDAIYRYDESDFKKIEYRILPSSNLEVNGKTNINSFTCVSEENFSRKILDYRSEQNNSSIYFRDTKFTIQVSQLDCGKKKINKDLFKALKVKEYPNITIHLKDAINLDCIDHNTCGEWLDYEVNTDITITCETRPVKIPILVKKLDDHSYQITGGTSLRLCDFDVETPTALLGLIKVKEEIKFKFDLFIDLANV